LEVFPFHLGLERMAVSPTILSDSQDAQQRRQHHQGQRQLRGQAGDDGYGQRPKPLPTTGSAGSSAYSTSKPDIHGFFIAPSPESVIMHGLH